MYDIQEAKAADIKAQIIFFHLYGKKGGIQIFKYMCTQDKNPVV